MKTTHAAPLGLRLFMEGIEVPCIGAQVSISASQPATAAIQIIPLDSALNFLPRTLVHLFFLEDGLTEEDFKARDAQDERNLERENDILVHTDYSSDPNRLRVPDTSYKLLFTGEVIGFNYNKSPSSRSVVLQCMDLSSYWDTCYQWFSNYGGNAFSDKQHSFVGSGYGIFNNITSGHKQVLSRLLNSKPRNPSYSDVKGLLGGIIHVMESIGGLRPSRGGEGYKLSSRGVNDFFSIGELRYSLTAMIGAVEGDTTSSRLYASRAFSSWLSSGMSSLGSLVTYRDILRQISGYVFHDVYPNPAAYYVPNIEKDVVRTTSWKDMEASGDIKKKIKEAQAHLQKVKNLLLRALTTLGLESSLATAYAKPISAALTALRNVIALLGEKGKGKAANVAAEAPVLKGDSPTLYVKVNTAMGYVSNFSSTIMANRVATDPLYVIYSRSSAQSSQAIGITTAIDLLKEALRLGKKATSTVKYSAKVGARLYNQLILPETFFIAPPRCNIIFPDQCTDFSYNRNFLREVSRLSMQGGVGIIGGVSSGGGLLGRYYYAPNIKNVHDKKFSGGRKGVLLPHEIHSGIIPKYEWVTDGHRWGMKAARGTGKSAKAKKINYIQRLANLKFLTHRWAARQISAKLLFAPNLVLGLPAVLLDRSAPSLGTIEALKNRTDLNSNFLPTAFLGKVAQVTHNISQQGASTSVVLTHCRTHRAMDDEFLDILQSEKAKLVTETRDVDPVKLADSGKAAPIDIWILKSYIKGTLQPGAKFGLLEVKTVKGKVGTTAGMELGDWAELGIVFNGFGLEYSRAKAMPKSIKVELQGQTGIGLVTSANTIAVEDAVKPKWYSEVWDKENLTKHVYGPLLGCTALTDDIQLGDAESISKLMKQLFDIDMGLAVNDSSGPADVSVSGSSLEVKYNGKEVTLSLAKEQSIERSVDGLTLLYGVMKKRGLDVHGFIREYTKRPIANMSQILGSATLEFDEQGAVKGGVEGFHSRAFGDYNTDVAYSVGEKKVTVTPGTKALAILDSKGGNSLKSPGYQKDALGNKVTKGASGLPPHMDPRGRAQRRVTLYMEELRFSRALSGG